MRVCESRQDDVAAKVLGACLSFTEPEDVAVRAKFADSPLPNCNSFKTGLSVGSWINPAVIED